MSTHDVQRSDGGSSRVSRGDSRRARWKGTGEHRSVGPKPPLRPPTGSAAETSAEPPLPGEESSGRGRLIWKGLFSYYSELPCWLTSFVVHLALLLLLASVFLPSPRDRSGLQVVALLEHPEEPREDSLQESFEIESPQAALQNQSLTSEVAVRQLATAEGLPESLLSPGQLAPATSVLLSGAQQRDFQDQQSLLREVSDSTLGAVSKPVSFMGVYDYFNSVVYVVDASGSMGGPKFVEAQRELMRSVESLKPNQTFAIYFFGSLTYGFPGDGETVPATKEQIELARQFVMATFDGGQTFPEEALKEALDMHPDVVFFMTDGELNNPAMSLRAIRQHHLDPTVVHTIGYDQVATRDFLEGIARRCGGQYRFCPVGQATP